ncbi:MAG: cyclic nucleotide-binding domain-containing protein [Candidatus Riflebacteria bacterium]|nr:cyclic nucleotide-binding domain-containing protein [Candidatus Riflebacteria bacterium]
MLTQQFLKGFFIFQDLTADEFASIGSIFKERRYPRGAMLFHMGEVPHELYLIERGSVEVFRMAGSNRQVITTVIGGETLGEISFFGAQARSASAVATSDVVAFTCEGEDFAKLLAENAPGIGKIMGRMMESTVRRFKLLEAKSQKGQADQTDSDTTAEVRLMHAIAHAETVRIAIRTGAPTPMEGLFHIVDVSNSLGVPLMRITQTKEAGGREYVVPMSSVHYVSFKDASGKY